MNEMSTTLIPIPANEIKRHLLSRADSNGRLFIWQNELYRGIYPRSAAFYQKLLTNGSVQGLVERGLLIDTDLVHLSLPDFALIVKHRRLPFVSVPYEWSAEMLRDAALLVLKLSMELIPSNLTLQDAHGWNILWDKGKPVFVDFCSISPIETGSWPINEFCSHFLYPLRFMTAGYGRLARWLLHDGRDGIRPSEYALLRSSDTTGLTRRVYKKFETIIEQSPLRRVRLILHHARTRMTQGSHADSNANTKLQQLYDEIAAMEFPKKTTEWSGYYDSGFAPVTPVASWTPKQRTVYEVLCRLQPTTVLDVGANKGWFSLLAAHCGAEVVAFDTDEICVDQLYLDVKRNGLPIQPLIMSFTYPSVGYGVNHSLVPPATERLRCELVLGLALTHHLVFKYYLSFDEIASAFAAFTTRALLVEFVPGDDQYVCNWMTDRHDWYMLDNFIAALKSYFGSITILPSYPEPRVLLLCER